MKKFIPLILLLTPIFAQDLIKELKITKKTMSVIAHKEFANKYLRQQFWIQYEDTTIDLTTMDESIALIPFLANIAPIVLFSNKQWHIPMMDADQYHSIEEIRTTFKQFWPEYEWSGSFVPNKLIQNSSSHRQPDDAIGVLFSGGLDATCTSLMHLNQPQLLLCYCGGDIASNNKTLWNNVKKQIRDYAQITGKECTFVRSNFWRFIRQNIFPKDMYPYYVGWWPKTSQGIGYTGLAMPLLHAKGYNKILIGSTVTDEIPYPYGTHPAIDNKIRCAGIQVVHDGGEYNRVQKAAAVGRICDEYGLAYPHLRTCWGHVNTGDNCYKCHKSLFTFFELSLDGYDPSEFGFNHPLEEIIAMTQQKLSEPIKSRYVTWHWWCIQQKSRELLEQNQFNSQLQSFFEWLVNVELDFSPTTNIDQEHTRFETLWREGAALI